MTAISLYTYATSPYGQKVACYLKYKQLDFNWVPVNPLNNEQIAFTKQKQVPVLKIGDEWRKDSSPLGIWLDQLYPEKPILPTEPDERELILNIDQWISDSLIPSYFRNAVEWQNTWHSIQNGWLLARTVSDGTPLPLYIRLIWPFAVKRAKFIVQMTNALDLKESLVDMNKRLQKEFIEKLQGGPFLGGQQTPSLADLSAFPVITSSTFMGMKRTQSLIDEPLILAWSKRVHEHLPKNPMLAAEHLLATTRL